MNMTTCLNNRFLWRCVLTLTAIATAGVKPLHTRAEPHQELSNLATASGVKFSMLGVKPTNPAPTLLVLAADAESSLTTSAFLQAGSQLQASGFICVSIDLPGHGAEQLPGEPEGLTAWRSRVDAGINPIHELTTRVSAVVDYLIENGYADPARIAVCGTSRGGFAALHVAAADSRFRCVAVYSPVTDVRMLAEFEGASEAAVMRQLDLSNLTAALQRRDIWLVIGDNDNRVNTDAAIEFARRLSTASHRAGEQGRIECHVCPSDGHVTPDGAATTSAEWIRQKCMATK